MFGLISLTDLAEVVGATVLVVGTPAALSKFPYVSRPIRWLGRTLIGDPTGRAMHRGLDSWADKPGGINEQIRAVRAEFRNNGGSSMRDLVESVGQQLSDHTDQDAENFAALEKRIANVQAAVCDHPSAGTE